MRHKLPRSFALIALAAAGIACSLHLAIDVHTNSPQRVVFTQGSLDYTQNFDLNSSDIVQKQKASGNILSVNLDSLDLVIVSVGVANRSQQVTSGTLTIHSDDPGATDVVLQISNFPITQGNHYNLKGSPELDAFMNTVLLHGSGKLSIHVVGSVDQAPADFSVEAVLHAGIEYKVF